MSLTIDLKKILQYWGTPFVTILYRCFLNREPDQDGLSYYLARLEQGTERIEIINQFIKSPETQRHFAKKDLLQLKIEIAKLHSANLVGNLPVLSAFSESLSRKERILMNRMYELQFHLQHPSIPSRSEFFIQHTAKTTVTPNNSPQMLNKAEQTLFNQILKSL